MNLILINMNSIEFKYKAYYVNVTMHLNQQNILKLECLKIHLL